MFRFLCVSFALIFPACIILIDWLGRQNLSYETPYNGPSFTLQFYTDIHAFDQYSYFWVTAAGWKLYAYDRNYSILIENDKTVNASCSTIIKKLDSLTSCFILERWESFDSEFIVTADMDTMPLHIKQSVGLEYFSEKMGEDEHILFGEDRNGRNCWTYGWDLNKWREVGIPETCPPIASFMMIRKSAIGKKFIQEWFDNMTNGEKCPYANDLSHPYEQRVMWFCMDWTKWRKHVKILPAKEHHAIQNQLYIHWGTKNPKPIWLMEDMWNHYEKTLDPNSRSGKFWKKEENRRFSASVNFMENT